MTPLVRDASPLVRESVRPEAAGLQARLDKVFSSRKAWQHQTTLETQLTRTSIMEGHDPEPFRKALTDYVKHFGATPRGEDARRVLDEQPVWAGAVAWEKLVESWGAASLLDAEPQLAAERAKECQRIMTDYPNCPDVALARRYHDYLEAIARREGLAPRDSGRSIGVRKELEAVWHEDFAADLRVITIEERGKRKRYYYVDPPEESETARKFSTFVDFVQANKKPLSFAARTRCSTRRRVRPPSLRRSTGRTWPGKQHGRRRHWGSSASFACPSGSRGNPLTRSTSST